MREMPTLQEQIEAFLGGSPHAVVGASTARHKYGNKVLRTYLQHDRNVYPVNPHADVIEGLAAVATLSDIPESVHGVSIITQPDVTEQVIAEMIDLEIRHVWIQPGAESDAAIAAATDAGINVIAGGPCLLVELGFRPAT